jgi:hypothetical protein
MKKTETIEAFYCNKCGNKLPTKEPDHTKGEGWIIIDTFKGSLWVCNERIIEDRLDFCSHNCLNVWFLRFVKGEEEQTNGNETKTS